MRASLPWRGILAAGAVCAVSLCTAAAASATPPPATLFVNGSPAPAHFGWSHGRSGRDCASAAFTTIGAAVSAAAPGSRIIVCPGLYHEAVVIDKPLTLIGEGAVIDGDATSSDNGVQIVGPGGSGSTVEGFTIKNSKFEGILVGSPPVAPTATDGTPATSGSPVSGVTIANNTVIDNDTGFGSTAGQCFSTPQAPGDCGEAIHLVSVTGSSVEGNNVSNNAGGILLTDEFGPTSGNIVRGNRSVDNTDDCGITLAGHATAVNPATGVPTGAAGVFNNLIEDNFSTGNGVAGQGAGILMGGGAPYAGVYGNVIRGNVAIGNGLSGVTIHQHLVGDLNGNVVENNVLIDNNLDGDTDFAAAVDSQTTGVLVASGVPPGPALPPFLVPGPIKGTVISGNVIFGENTGIWTLGVDPGTTTITGNVFGAGVVTQVATN